MKIWALSDPHLGFGTEKPMGVFGHHWDGHAKSIAAAWQASVAPEDVVILSGDISWAINYEELRPDFEFLNNLPGRKYIGRGNHDYWWESLRKNRQFCQKYHFENFEFIRSNAFVLGSANDKASILCGTRGWITPYHSEWKQSDEKYFKRERIRLQLALDAALQLRVQNEALIVALHYPPFGPQSETTAFTEMLESYGVSLCIFGHVHGFKGRSIKEQKINEVLYLNTACDVLHFQPLNVGAVSARLLQ